MPFKWSLILRLPTPTSNTLYVPLLSQIRSTCPAPLILFDLITRKIFVEGYEVMKLFITEPPLVTSQLLLLRPSYLRQHSILR